MANSSRVIKIATRKSALAMWQANYVKDQLEHFHPQLTVVLVPMSTQGDRILDTPLAQIAGKGLFIKELEIAMQNNEADLAVQSMKDVPVHFPEEFGLHAICPHENPLDARVPNTFSSLDALPEGAVVGTSSLRRQAQIRARRPDLLIKDLRGNVNTRLGKLDAGQYDAIILAAAGLIRLKMQSRIAEEISPEISLPAVGQGAVGIECRNDDAELINLLASLNDQETAWRVRAERAMNAGLEGGCQVPIGSFAQLDGEQIILRGLVATPDGSNILRAEATGSMDEPEKIGIQVANDLISQGAAAILSALHNES